MGPYHDRKVEVPEPLRTLVPDEGLIKTWNALLKQLDDYFEKAIAIADSEPDLQYIKGYKAGLESARKLVKSLEAEESKEPVPEEIH